MPSSFAIAGPGGGGGGGGGGEEAQLPPLDGGPPPPPAAAPYIHMDAMAFGMGCCCLQVTFQARNLAESRVLYDQLSVLSPLLLALTANAPMWRGHLADTDTRWAVISASVDCRTPTERGAEGSEEPPLWQALSSASGAAGGGATRLPKSRYSSIDCYIADDPRLDDALHNDLPVIADASVAARLRGAGVDERLARHVAALFVRDPLVMFKGRITELDDASSAAHFESIQSTNWRSMRWKPPPADAVETIGWRVELRTMEVQLTDFENAAFTVFVVLLSRVILFFDLNLYMPLSLVDANFERANMRSAAAGARFWFPPVICSRRGAPGAPPPPPPPPPVEMTLAQILLGDGSATFPGLLPLVSAYLDLNGCDKPSRAAIGEYLSFIRNRATGAALTGAAWQREFVVAHPAYARDSVVPLGAMGDLVRAVAALPAESKARGGSSGVFERLVGPLQGAGTAAAAAATTAAHAAGGGSGDGGAAGPASGGGGAEEVLPSDAPAAEGGVRLRGSSFFEELRRGPSSACTALKELIDKHRGAL